jgi:hypothetical protein
VTHPKPPFSGQQQERPGSTDKVTPRPDPGEHSYRGNGKLNGRVALITGADSGIGRAVAIAFAREGADVVVSYLCEDQEARETAHWVEKAGRRALTFVGDIADPTHCRRLVDRALQGLSGSTFSSTTPPSRRPTRPSRRSRTREWDRTFRTNIYSMVLPGQGGGAVPQARLRHRQYRLDRLEIPVARASRLRDNRQFHRGARPASRRQGNSGQLCGAGTDLDPADPHPQCRPRRSPISARTHR